MDKQELLSLIDLLDSDDIDIRVNSINKIRLYLKEHSPFIEPVETVLWVKSDDVIANDYNPNKVAPPEMKLLELSIKANGYTQPIVTWINDEGKYEVIDGFHRHRVGKEVADIQQRIKGYLPVVVVNNNSTDRGERISATIRHNRARGKHTIDGMAEIVLELKKRNWSDEKIGKNLGMDPDEVLRLSQITGLAEMFKDREFSKAWEALAIDMEDNLDESENEPNISQS